MRSVNHCHDDIPATKMEDGEYCTLTQARKKSACDIRVNGGKEKTASLRQNPELGRLLDTGQYDPAAENRTLIANLRRELKQRLS